MFRRWFERETPADASPTNDDRDRQHATLVTELQHAEQQLVEDLAGIGLSEACVRAAAIRTQLDDANTDVAERRFRDTQRRHQFDRECARLHQTLVGCADPRIDACLAWIQDELDGLNRKIVRTEGLGRRDLKTGVRRTERGSNLGAIAVISAALVVARTRAQALKLESVPDLVAELDALRRSIPTMEEAEVAAAREDTSLLPAS